MATSEVNNVLPGVETEVFADRQHTYRRYHARAGDKFIVLVHKIVEVHVPFSTLGMILNQ